MSNDRVGGSGTSRARRRGIRVWLKRLAWLIAALAAAILALILWLWVQSGRPLPLAQARGPFAVGRLRYELTEPLASDSSASGPHQPRRVVMWIWYPAEPGSGRKAAYVPEPLRSPLRARNGAITNLIIRDVDLVRAEARTGAAVAQGQRRFPILLLKSGIGALALDYTSLAESLASAGYVVVGSDAPHSAVLTAYEDGSVVGRTSLGHPSPDRPAAFEPLVRIWAADTRYELDALARLDAQPGTILAHRLDLGHVGAFGHSFGGAAATEFCWEDPRCKAAADIDGRLFGPVVQAGLAKPFLFLMSDHGRESDPAAHQIMTQLRAFWAKLGAAKRLTTIRGTRHFNFSDNALRWTRLVGRPTGAVGPIDRRRALVIGAREIDAFFSAPLGQPQKPEPEDEAILHDWVAPPG